MYVNERNKMIEKQIQLEKLKNKLKTIKLKIVLNQLKNLRQKYKQLVGGY